MYDFLIKTPSRIGNFGSIKWINTMIREMIALSNADMWITSPLPYPGSPYTFAAGGQYTLKPDSYLPNHGWYRRRYGLLKFPRVDLAHAGSSGPATRICFWHFTRNRENRILVQAFVFIRLQYAQKTRRQIIENPMPDQRKNWIWKILEKRWRNIIQQYSSW